MLRKFLGVIFDPRWRRASPSVNGAAGLTDSWKNTALPDRLRKVQLWLTVKKAYEMSDRCNYTYSCYGRSNRSYKAFLVLCHNWFVSALFSTTRDMDYYQGHGSRNGREVSISSTDEMIFNCIRISYRNKTIYGKLYTYIHSIYQNYRKCFMLSCLCLSVRNYDVIAYAINYN